VSNIEAVVGQLAEGQQLRDFQIISVAGTGGMGVVYKATQRSLGRTVALKVIRDEIANTSEYHDRFLREAKLAASVDHPNVVAVYDVGEDDGHLWLAMQWIDGRDLRSLIESFGPRMPDRAVAITAQLGSALDAVHATGLIHRDVKPANVLIRDVDNKDHAYLTDFGVAKPPDHGADQLTRTGSIVGTTGYLSPEQIRGNDPGPRSDLYALGCVFFEMLTGRPPFAGENELAVRWAHANDPRPTISAVRPDLGTRYDTFVAHALAVDPSDRFRSGRELSEALQAAHAGDPTSVLPPGVPHTPTAVGPPTPLPPAPTPVPQPPAYPPYGYTTPPPAYPQPSRSGNPLALILLGLVALAGIAIGGLAAAGVFSGKSSTTQTITSTQAAHTTTPTKSAAHVLKPRAAPAAGTTSCGGDLSVGPNTSCGFAQNVEQAYGQTSGGSQVVSAFSSATGTTYTINCRGGSPHVCTGGTTNDASVYFTSGPSGTTTPSAPAAPAAPSSTASTAGLRACDQNVSASASTSCKFAENVFYEYSQSSQGASGQVMTIYSPTTQQDYAVTCTPDQQANVDCSTNTNAYTTFSQQSVSAYTPSQASAYAASADLGNSSPNG
jgi:serine/threonine protein kinase